MKSLTELFKILGDGNCLYNSIGLRLFDHVGNGGKLPGTDQEDVNSAWHYLLDLISQKHPNYHIPAREKNNDNLQTRWQAFSSQFTFPKDKFNMQKVLAVALRQLYVDAVTKSEKLKKTIGNELIQNIYQQYWKGKEDLLRQALETGPWAVTEFQSFPGILKEIEKKRQPFENENLPSRDCAELFQKSLKELNDWFFNDVKEKQNMGHGVHEFIYHIQKGFSKNYVDSSYAEFFVLAALLNLDAKYKSANDKRQQESSLPGHFTLPTRKDPVPMLLQISGSHWNVYLPKNSKLLQQMKASPAVHTPTKTAVNTDKIVEPTSKTPNGAKDPLQYLTEDKQQMAKKIMAVGVSALQAYNAIVKCNITIDNQAGVQKCVGWIFDNPNLSMFPVKVPATTVAKPKTTTSTTNGRPIFTSTPAKQPLATVTKPPVAQKPVTTTSAPVQMKPTLTSVQRGLVDKIVATGMGVTDIQATNAVLQSGVRTMQNTAVGFCMNWIFEHPEQANKALTPATPVSQAPRNNASNQFLLQRKAQPSNIQPVKMHQAATTSQDNEATLFAKLMPIERSIAYRIIKEGYTKRQACDAIKQSGVDMQDLRNAHGFCIQWINAQDNVTKAKAPQQSRPPRFV